VAVPDDLECNLVLDLFDAEARGRLILDDEPLDLIVGEIARPDNGCFAGFATTVEAVISMLLSS
jgi:hypothetical protein